MKVIFKKFTTMVFVTTLILSMVACGAAETNVDMKTSDSDETTEVSDGTSKKDDESDNLAADKEWKLVKTESYKISVDGGELKISEVQYEYDEKGNMIKSVAGEDIKEYLYDDMGRVIQIQEGDTCTSYEYDENGKVIKELVTSKEGGKEWVHSKYEVDNTGKVVWDMQYNAEGMAAPDSFGYTYDESGRLEQYIYVWSSGAVTTTTYMYDAETGYLKSEYTVKERVSREGGLKEPVFESATEYEYDADGRLVKKIPYTSETDYEDKRQNEWHVYEYDAVGNCIETICSPSGEIRFRTEYKYDADGNCIEEIRYHEGKLVFDHEYTYDQYGNLCKDISYKDGIIDEQAEYTYASDGTLLKEVRKEGEEVVYWFEKDEAGHMLKEHTNDGVVDYGNEWTWDADGNLLERKTFRDGAISNIHKCQYESGRLIKEEDINSEGTVTSETNYNYDKFGNLIEKIHTNNSQKNSNTQSQRTVYIYE